jgi:hypothetical protein
VIYVVPVALLVLGSGSPRSTRAAAQMRSDCAEQFHFVKVLDWPVNAPQVLHLPGVIVS